MVVGKPTLPSHVSMHLSTDCVMAITKVYINVTMFWYVHDELKDDRNVIPFEHGYRFARI